MKSKNIIRIAIGTGVILLIPLVLTLLGSGVDGEGFHWTLGDFVVIGVLLFGTGLIYELITSKVDKRYRVFIGVVLLAVLLLVWADLAVGIFNIPGFSGS